MSWGGLSKIAGNEAMDSDKNSNVYRTRSSDSKKSDESLGILDMDGLSGFGENSVGSTKDHPIAERLQIQRLKALRTLEKISGNSSLASTSSYPSDSRAPRSQTPGLDRTDYVPYRRCESINISDLIADHTIDVQSMSSIGTTNKISFEPSEITGRSTMCIPGNWATTRPQPGYQKSVKEILAQSCAADIRSLSETLPESYDGNASLPRTEDNIGNGTASESFRSNSLLQSSLFSNCRRTDDTEFNEESFTPAEFMNSKLAADEMAWEQQYATIPTSNFNQSKKLSPEFGSNISRAPSSDFSIGDFFNKRSEKLADMMPNVMSPTKQPAFALVEDSMRFSNRTISSLASTSRSNFEVSTPKIADKTYSRYWNSSNKAEKESAPKRPSDVADNSYSLSVSAIANALNDLHTEDSASVVLNRFLQPMRVKSYMHAPEPIVSLYTKNSNKSMPSSSKFAAPYQKDENVAEKENWNPHNFLSDTASLSDSALDFSNLKLPYVEEMPEKSPNQLQLPLSQVKSRKRSHSSTRLDCHSVQEHAIPIRRSRSPSTLKELSAASSTSNRQSSAGDTNTKGFLPDAAASSLSYELENSPARSDHTITASDRLFLVDSKSPDCGKYSLPINYGLNSRPTTSMSNAGKASRCNSQCSNSSEFSHRDGKLPLKATCLELSWGSVKLRTTVQKPIQIKNTSNKRLVIRAEVAGPGFQIVATQEHGNLMTLQSQECRTVCISFCPTVIGSAAGQLMFLPPYGTAVAQQIIYLYGYGGHASVAYQGISKGPVGSAYLPMGELRQLSSPLEVSFILYNKGPLPGFARIYVDSTGLDLPRLCDCIEVKPKNLIIQPEGRAQIHVTFRPRREDIKKILKKISDVITLANMRIICGDDATRQRIRNLIRQMKDTEKSKVTSTSISRLWDAFPGEKHLDELELLKEKSETAFDLLATLRTYEIAITLNHSVMDTTIHTSFMFPDDDETIMFRTLISTDTTLCSSTTDDASSKLYTDSLSVHRNNVESWSVRPIQLEIDPFDKKTKTSFTVRSNFFVKKSLRIDVNFNHILRCSPLVGDLMPGGLIEVTVEMLSNCLPSEQLQIIVFVEKEKLILPVKVIKDKFPAHFI